MSKPALLLIDLQNDYFPGGAFPLVNTEAALAAVEQAIRHAQSKGLPVVHVQHVADPAQGIAPFCGMMTQNCVTHTALSRQADAYERVTVLTDACTTVSEMLHAIALHALSTRVQLVDSASNW